MTEVTAHSGLLKNVKVHVEDTGGPGRPVVLIHGWPLSGESWAPQGKVTTRRPTVSSTGWRPSGTGADYPHCRWRGGCGKRRRR